jgi:hypothetical protein
MNKPNYRDSTYWESLASKPSGHQKVVNALKEVIKSKYDLTLGEFDDNWKKDVWTLSRQIKLTSKKGKIYHRTINYVPHIPDIMIKYGATPQSWLYIDYVNTEGRNLIRDYRGMIALEAVMKIRGMEYLGFILALRDSFREKYTFYGSYKYFKISLDSLTYLIKCLDEKRLQSTFAVW